MRRRRVRASIESDVARGRPDPEHKAHTHASPHPWLPPFMKFCFLSETVRSRATLLSAGTHTSLGSESTGSLVFSDLIAERGEVQYDGINRLFSLSGSEYKTDRH